MSSIKKNIGSGVFYTALSKYSNVFISLFISAILARLLTPEEFGVVAIVAVFLSFFNLLSDFGLGPAIVQNKTFTPEDDSSIFSFSILFGLFLAVVFYFSSPLIASFYNNPVLINLARLMSLSILFNSLRVVPNALLLKRLKFKQIAIVSIIANIVSGITGIILAYNGFSYYSLVINSILSGLLIFVSYYLIVPIKIALKIQISSVRKIARFSVFQFLFNFINYFARNADNLLIGKYFSASALGFYDRSYRLMKMPVQNLTHVITPVLHPVLSEYQNDKKLIYRAYSKIVKLLATIGFPLSVFLFFAGSEIITIVYGKQWIESIPVFQILSLTIGIQIILSSSGSIFQSTNRTDLLFYAGLIGAALLLSGIGYGVFFGKTLISVGSGILAALIINFFVAFYLLIDRALSSSLLHFLKVFLFPMIISAAVAAALLLYSQFELENIIFSFIAKTVIFIFILGFFILISKENREMLKEYSKKIFKGG